MAAKQEGRRAKRQFTDEFKAGAVRLVLEEGKRVAEVARDLGLTPSTLRVWVERARADRTGRKTGLTTDERADLAALRKEMRVAVANQANCSEVSRGRLHCRRASIPFPG